MYFIPRSSKMRFSICISILFLSQLTITPLNGQIEKTISIYSHSLNRDYIDAIIYYDSDNNPVDTIIRMYGNDMRYPSLNQMVFIFTGEPDQLVEFLLRIERFHSEHDPGTSMTILDRRVSITKQFGIKGVHVYEPNDFGYREFNIVYIKKMRKKVSEWMAIK
jgi:hypothetical protein